MMKNLRLTILAYNANSTSGWGNIPCEYCRALNQRNDIEFNLYVPLNASIDENLPFFHRIYRALPRFQPTFRRRWHRILPFMLPNMRLNKTDIVHSLVEFPFGILAWSLSRRYSIPFGFTAQGTYGIKPFLNWFDRYCFMSSYQTADFIIAPSHFTESKMQEISRKPRPVTVIHNAVNYERFQIQTDRLATLKRLNLPLNARVLLGVGALKNRKGFDLLIKAFSEVAHIIPDAYLVIVGDGTERANLLSQAQSLGIADHVKLPGSLSGIELVSCFQVCEVYAHLPRNINWNFEGFGIVYLEAGACGKPVVASRSGGVEDAVINGQTGLLVAEEDASGAAKAILKLFKDPVFAQRLGEGGNQYAHKHSWSWYVDKMVSIYRQVIEQWNAKESLRRR